MSSRFTEIAEKGLNNAVFIAEELGHAYIGSEHILLSLCKESASSASTVLKKNGIEFSMLEKAVREYSGVGAKTSLTPKDMSPKARRIVENSYRISLKYNALKVGTEHILLSIVEDGENVACRLLKNMRLDFTKVTDDLLQAIKANTQMLSSVKPKGEKESLLDVYGKNLTALAKINKLGTVIGRNEETERLIRILSRKTKNNPCLIGEAGVGKTAIVEGLAERIVSGNVPEALLDKKIYSLDLTAMIAGAKYRGDFEERIKNLISEASRDKSIILFIDEIHTIVGAGAAEGAIDASNILKPQLARAEIQLIGATTYSEYRKYIERDGALDRRFQTIKVEEPSIESALEMLNGIKGEYEKHHKITISDEAIEAVVRLSVRYIPNKFLPDKAIDILDEACAKISTEIAFIKENAEQKNTIPESEAENNETFSKYSRVLVPRDIEQIVSEITGIKITGLKNKESLDLESVLKERIVGQDRAVKEVTNSIYASQIGFFSDKRPRGVFMFVGESGTGKTLLAKELAKAIFKNEKDFIRYDMSEFSEPSSINKLIGSPPGYVGYQDGGTLTEKMRLHPYSLVLFDEIDKAHQEVVNLLLNTLDEGILTDANGRTASFKDAYIVFTANFPEDAKLSVTGFIGESACERESVFKNFPAEFTNRIDKIIFFDKLNETALYKIAESLFSEFTERLSELGIEFSYRDEIVMHCVKKAINNGGGARGLTKVIKSFFEDEILPQIYLSGAKELNCELIDEKCVTLFEKQKAHLI